MQRSALERALLAEGHAHICGCDEAGRGALAGPVVAAAVVLDYRRPIPGIEDSKALSREAREKLAPRIRERARAWAVCAMDVREIERLNILHAALAAMYSAMGQLGLSPDYVLIDGPHLPRDLATAGHPPAQAVIDGDAQIACIAAASILAKVERDRLMRELHDSYPHYGFAQHVGYGTPQHLAALQAHGPCEQHRRSFRPVQAILQGELFDTAQLTAE